MPFGLVATTASITCVVKSPVGSDLCIALVHQETNTTLNSQGAIVICSISQWHIQTDCTVTACLTHLCCWDIDRQMLLLSQNLRYIPSPTWVFLNMYIIPRVNGVFDPRHNRSHLKLNARQRCIKQVSLHKIDISTSNYIHTFSSHFFIRNT
jgi:hypothetical protein